MHERTQRSLARLVFVACCALPTLLTLACIAATWTPWYDRRCRTAIEARLSNETGLQVAIEDFTILSPYATQLDRVRLSEPETGAEVATVASVHWSEENGQTVIVLQQPELQASTLRWSWRLIHDRFLCRPERQKTVTRFAANDLTIHSKQEPITLRDVQAWIEPQSDVNSSGDAIESIQATIACVTASDPSATPIRVSIRRELAGKIPETLWSLQTGDTALPCSFLAEYFSSQWSNLGNNATFTGTLAVRLQEGHWAVDANGRLGQLALDRIFERQTHRLSGTATLHLDRCRIEPARELVDISGAVEAADGVIGRSLLYAAKNHLDFAIAMPEGDEDILYDRLAMQFNLHGPDLRIHGMCRQELGFERMPVDVAMRIKDMPLALSSPDKLPAVRLMALLAPSHSELVPLADQNRHLLPLIIPPRHASPATMQNASPPRIRSARRYEGNGPLTGQPR
ncbi:hypothetical protein N9N28_06095 [Rubripirellula amarantea]|uniref:AsmA-like C-terminal domain-containing protein n=1 Tax=Rubripirellula amarantea TaxID=2527999 RepID=A0A5C5WSX3_9BACT|nr:hypothetical protein [Rubripirellula amarantea]MDA8744187.1 hypothetical protein [Rubripirellula amarantea]TWT53259.1 hypothetical protein Pla22_08870 [Rubripirellula amarantea]